MTKEMKTVKDVLLALGIDGYCDYCNEVVNKTYPIDWEMSVGWNQFQHKEILAAEYKVCKDCKWELLDSYEQKRSEAFS